MEPCMEFRRVLFRSGKSGPKAPASAGWIRPGFPSPFSTACDPRSEEGRGGQEGRSWWLPCVLKTEDARRDGAVHGVQTCALPIWEIRAESTGQCRLDSARISQPFQHRLRPEIGRGSWRARGEILVVAVCFKNRRRQKRWSRAWSSDVCSSDLGNPGRKHRPVPAGFGPDFPALSAPLATRDRKRVVEGKRGDLGGCRVF